jgi:hypothetical protein
MCPADKVIGTSTTPVVVEVIEHGFPHWTRIKIGDEQETLNEEQMHDLHHATGRAISFMKRARKYDEHFNDR